MEARNGLATAEEQAALVLFPGWGWTGNLLHPENSDRSSSRYYEFKRLTSGLSPEELSAARRATRNSHFTSPTVISSMWNAVRGMGFNGGKVIEPSAGIGLYFGLMPEELQKGTLLRGVEMDDLTGRILQQLYQKASIDISPFQDLRIPDNQYDLAISNVPFGNIRIHDKDFERKAGAGLTRRVHNYFFGKSLDKVRPGGLVAFITSHGTLDAIDLPAQETRKYIANNTTLLGAIRLPNTAFRGNANTEVTTDIIFLQKRTDTEPIEDTPNFQQMGFVKGPEGEEIRVNQYFIDHPEMVLGSHSMAGKMRGGASEYTVMPEEGKDLADALADAVARLPKGVYKQAIRQTSEAPPTPKKPRGKARLQSFDVDEQGSVIVHTPDGPKALDTEPIVRKRIVDFVNLRNTVTALIQAQKGELTDADLKTMQAAMKKAYNAYVKAHGPLHATQAAWTDDPESWTVLSIERWNGREKKVTGLSDIFTKRVISPDRSVDTAETPADALTVSLRQRGRVDLAYMSQITNIPVDDITSKLSEGGMLYKDASDGWVTRDEYGSGNVRAKLIQAQYNATEDGPDQDLWKRQADYLESVQPTQLKISDISIKPGAQWVPVKYYQQFLAHLLNSNPEWMHIKYSPVSARWQIERPGTVHSAQSLSKWGTEKKPAHELLEAIMNSRQVNVNTKDEKGNPITDHEGTQLARAKTQEIKEEWKRWVTADPNRSRTLAQIYNEEVNVYRTRKFDGSHLQLPGINPAWQMRVHQNNAIWRGLQQRYLLFAHGVGTGKTATMIALSMELRRLGLRNKPMFALKGATVGQIAESFKYLYPGAKILVGDKLDANNRKEFMGKIATGDWDAVLLSHAALKLLSMHPDTITRFYNERIRELEDYLYAVKAETGKKDFTVKQIENAIDNIRTKLADRLSKLEEGKDDAIYWEDLGVDHLIVDESHTYKNLEYQSHLEGMGGKGSDIAFDMFMKVRSLQELGGGVTFASGTPITNSVAEIHGILKYLGPDLLKEQGIEHFDAWAQQYADLETVLERTVTGAFAQKTRFIKFSNVPELLALYGSVADRVNSDDVPELVKPAMVDRKGKVTNAPIVVEVPVSNLQRQYFASLGRRAKNLKPRREMTKGDDTMLSISTDGRHASLDIRLRVPGAPDDPNSKINQVVKNILWEYKQLEAMKNKRTQLVFLDMGVPGNKQLNLYADIRKKLIAGGIPGSEIKSVYNCKNDDERDELFENVNAGNVRVLMGSREKMGVGVNVQERPIAAHQVDPTWRPDQMEQADGRILRHGNLYFQHGVRIYQYITVNSFDSFMWDKLRNKAGFIRQTMIDDPSVRESEDMEGEGEFNYAEIAAVASGNPHLVEYVNLQSILKDMDVGRRADADSKAEMLKTAEYDEVESKRLVGLSAEYKQLANYADGHAPTDPKEFKVTIRGSAFEKRAEADKALWEVAMSQGRYDLPKKLTTFRGFDIYTEKSSETGTPVVSVRSPGDMIDPGDIDLQENGDHFRRIENSIRKAEGMAEGLKARSERLAEDTRTLNEESKKPWPREAEYAELMAKYRKLEAEIGASLTGEAGKNITWGTEVGETNNAPEPATEPSPQGPTKREVQYDLDMGEHAPIKIDPKELMEATRRLQATVRSNTRLPKRVLGRFSPGKIEVGDIRNTRSIAHELGHAIDALLYHGHGPGTLADRVGGNDPELMRELKPVSRLVRPRGKNPPPKGYRDSAPELFADYVSLYIHDPFKAQELAPQFTARFADTINKYPAVREVLDQLHGGNVEPEIKASDRPVTKPLNPIRKLIKPKIPKIEHDLEVKSAGEELVKSTVRDRQSNLFKAFQAALRWQKELSESQLEDVGAAVEGIGNLRIAGDTGEKVVARLNAMQKQVLKDYRYTQELARQSVNSYMRGSTDDEYLKYLDDYLARFFSNSPATLRDFARKWTMNSPNAKQRKFPTMQDAVEAGLTPVTQNIATLHRMWADINWKVATNRAFVAQAKYMKLTDGTPAVVPSNKPHPGWVHFDHPAIAKVYAKKMPDGSLQLWKGGVDVHPDLAPAFKMLLESPVSSRWWRAYDAVNAFSKETMLSFSLFHPTSLTENAQGVLAKAHNPIRGIVVIGEKHPVTGKRIIATQPHHLGMELFNTEWATDAIQHGLTLTPPSEGTERGLTGLMQLIETHSRQIPVVGAAARIGRQLMNVQQRKLWDEYHPGLKLFAYYDLVRQELMAHPEVSENEIKENVARFLNNAFGGQEWDTKFKVSPAGRKWLSRGILAPDWTLSTVNTGMGVAARSAVTRNLSLKYWLKMLATLAVVVIGGQAAIYELAGDDDKGDHPYPWDNEPGRKINLDVTPIVRQFPWHDDSDKRRVYLNLAKQARETADWVEDPMRTLGYKLAPNIRGGIEQITGASTTGYPLPWKGKPFYEGLPSRVTHVVSGAVPISMQSGSFVAPVRYSPKTSKSRTRVIGRKQRPHR